MKLRRSHSNATILDEIRILREECLSETQRFFRDIPFHGGAAYAGRPQLIQFPQLDELLRVFVYGCSLFGNFDPSACWDRKENWTRYLCDETIFTEFYEGGKMSGP